MVSKIVLAQAGHQPFPPQQQHRIVALATQFPQQEAVPITHWSSSDLAGAAVQKGIVNSISPATVWRLLDQAAIKPHRWHYWLNSPDPDFEVKMLDVVQLYLEAFQLCKRGEVVLCVDEKTSIQALQRKYPHKGPMPGKIELIEHEYIRHGTCCLTAGLEVATGDIIGMLSQRRRAEEFVQFIEWIANCYRDAEKIHLVLDNLNTHYHQSVCRVIANICKCVPGAIDTSNERKGFLSLPQKRIVFHFTPTHASWLNQIEIWLSVLSRKVIRRGDFNSVDELQDKIIAFIEYYNEHLAKPYRWTYTGKPLAVTRQVA